MTSVANQTSASPWHEGERSLQRSLGVEERMEQIGSRVIRDYLPDQYREFFAQLPFVVLGSVDPEGNPWASIASGQPGFMSSPDPRQLNIALRNDPRDPAHAGLSSGSAIGLLGIELASRRRNRMNGVISQAGPDDIAIVVGHSFGNCPQYIQQRDWHFAREPDTLAQGTPIELDLLDCELRQMVEGADTFFVASSVDTQKGRQIDASHRGGKPGFVRMDDDGLLTIPDFAGNLHFNTLGNFLVNPRAGLLFVDFETGDLLQLTGEAEIILDSPEIAAFQGAERLWTFRPHRAVLRRSALPIRFAFQQEGWSPNALMTGDWQQASRRLEAARLQRAWRPFRIARVVDESRSIRSFYLEPADGHEIIAHRAGQHLPIRVQLPGGETPTIRTYTLSTAPSDGHYRISVKREEQGQVSRHLHDALSPGDMIEARAPAGGFTIDAAARRPAILLGAGIGITPMLAMLRHLVFEGKRTRRTRPTWLMQAASSRSDRAFDIEIAQLAESAQGAVNILHLVSKPEPGDHPGTKTGRISAEILRDILPLDDYDFYLCGPPGFMQSAYDSLLSLGIADRRIHAETFGPASLKRQIESTAPPQEMPEPAEHPVPVSFAGSDKEARWEPESGTLLELAETRDLKPEHSCRSGSCGSCAVKLLSGRVAYPLAPSAAIPDGQVLICSAVPASEHSKENGGKNEPLILDL